MLKSKPKKIEEAIKKTEEVKSVDINPILVKLENLTKELNALKEKLPETFNALSTAVQEVKQVETPNKFVEEFKNINDKFFDINLLLTSFVNTQSELINKDSNNVDNPLLIDIKKQLELIQQTTPKIEPKKDWEGTLDVLRDNNGIYKVIATPKN